MADSRSSDPDTQGLLLAMNNALGAILRTHPNPRALAQALAELTGQQADAFEHDPPPPALAAAFERYSANFAAAVPAKPVPLQVNADLEIRLK